MIRNVIFDIGGVFIEWDQNKAFREFGFSDETIRKIQQSMLAPEVGWKRI
jgi:FMN phosphatase YigB (HAD superfamily)